jgi:hypothetical protein
MHEYLPPPEPSQDRQPRRIGDVLAELLSQYQSRFPNARVVILETRPFVVADVSAFEPPVASLHES